MPQDAVSGSLREAVLAGPGAPVALDHCQDVAGLVLRPSALAGALVAAGHRDVRNRALPAAMTAAAVLGLCLYSGEGQDSVLARIWPLTAPLRPGFGVGSPEVVTAPALPKARGRLPVSGSPWTPGPERPGAHERPSAANLRRLRGVLRVRVRDDTPERVTHR